MLRWSLPLLAAFISALATLTIFKAPNLFTWKLAILAGEYGHFFWLLALLLGAVTFLPGFSVPAVVLFLTRGLCVTSLALFLRPVLQARRIGETLPAQMAAAFGPFTVERPAFSLRRLFVWSSRRSEFETKIYSFAGTPEALALDFYPACHAETKAAKVGSPCVVVIHAGGWDNGDRKQFLSLNERLARQGYAVAAIDYRLAPSSPWPAQRDDVQAALAYLKNHAAELGLDPTRFVLLGRSAGGQIAEAVAYGSEDPAIRGVIALYAPADLNFAWKYARADDVLNTFQLLKQYLGGEPKIAQKNYDEASAYLHVRRATPPTLLIHGQLDTLVWHRQSERLAARLAEEKVPCVFLDLPWATHALDINLDGPGGQLSTFAIEWFLATVASR